MSGDDQHEALRPPDVFPGEELDLLDPAATPRLLPITPPASAAQLPSRYRHSAGASLLAAGLLGLRDIIEPPVDERPVREQYVDEGEGDRAIEVYLDPDDPTSSMVVIRDPFDSN